MRYQKHAPLLASITSMFVAYAAGCSPTAAAANETIDISCYRSKAGQPDWQAIAKDFANHKLRTSCQTSRREQPEPRLRQANARSLPADAPIVVPPSPPPRSDF